MARRCSSASSSAKSASTSCAFVSRFTSIFMRRRLFRIQRAVSGFAPPRIRFIPDSLRDSHQQAASNLERAPGSATGEAADDAESFSGLSSETTAAARVDRSRISSHVSRGRANVVRGEAPWARLGLASARNHSGRRHDTGAGGSSSSSRGLVAASSSTRVCAASGLPAGRASSNTVGEHCPGSQL